MLSPSGWSEAIPGISLFPGWAILTLNVFLSCVSLLLLKPWWNYAGSLILNVFQGPVSSGQLSCSVVSDSLVPHEPQHARPPCPSPTPRVPTNPGPLVRDAIQPSHPLSSPSPPTFNLFQWVSSSHQVANVLEFQLQHQSFQWTPRTDLL